MQWLCWWDAWWQNPQWSVSLRRWSDQPNLQWRHYWFLPLFLWYKCIFQIPSYMLRMKCLQHWCPKQWALYDLSVFERGFWSEKGCDFYCDFTIKSLVKALVNRHWLLQNFNFTWTCSWKRIGKSLMFPLIFVSRKGQLVTHSSTRVTKIFWMYAAVKLSLNWDRNRWIFISQLEIAGYPSGSWLEACVSFVGFTCFLYSLWIKIERMSYLKPWINQ